jgi:hypothetical protein
MAILDLLQETKGVLTSWGPSYLLLTCYLLLCRSVGEE